MQPGPTPTFDELLDDFGVVGARLTEIDAAEGAAGNLSVYCGWALQPGLGWSLVETIQLPLTVPTLAGHSFIVTGSGRRLREIQSDPQANLGCLVVDPGGETGQLRTSPRRKFTRLTSEFNSHLAVHGEQVALTGTKFHSLVHAQPPHLTYLSHIERYRDTVFFNQRVIRWEPELILQLPEGIGVLPFCVPGSAELMEHNRAGMRRHRVVVWSKHGVMARSMQSLRHACDLVDYAEAGACYEVMNLSSGEKGEGLTLEEIRAVCAAYHVEQSIFTTNRRYYKWDE